MYKQKIAPFLMFTGQAEEAINYYIALFCDSEIIEITRYGANEAGREGSVLLARFSLKGQEFMCIDSNITHDFTFTPAMSLYVNCDSEEEIETAFKALTKDGAVLMPLGAYPFSKKYAWVADKFGVSWQLNFS